MNYYEMLNVPYHATMDMIKESFRKISKKHHPDISKGSSVDYRLILDAYKTLIDEKKREEYNKKLYKEWTAESVRKTNQNATVFLAPQDRIEYSLSLDKILKSEIRIHRSLKHKDYVEFLGQDIIVYLTPLEVKLGAAVPLEVPAKSVCPDCSGSRWECHRCGGKGFIRVIERFNYLLSQSAKNGDIIEINPQKYMPPASITRIKQLRMKVEFIDSESQLAGEP